MKSPRRLLSRMLVVLAFVLGSLATTSSARADDSAPPPPDTVFLKNGGRLRGTVVEEDPTVGVTIKLLDGTTRKVPKKNVDRVEYAPTPAAEVAVAPVAPAPVAPPAPPPQPQYYAPMYRPQPPQGHRSRALLVMGIIFMPVGAVTILGGAAYLASDSHSKDETYATVIIGGGLAVLATGIVFTILGARHRAPSDDAAIPAAPRLALGGEASRAYLTPEAGGLTLHF